MIDQRWRLKIGRGSAPVAVKLLTHLIVLLSMLPLLSPYRKKKRRIARRRTQPSSKSLNQLTLTTKPTTLIATERTKFSSKGLNQVTLSMRKQRRKCRRKQRRKQRQKRRRKQRRKQRRKTSWIDRVKRCRELSSEAELGRETSCSGRMGLDTESSSSSRFPNAPTLILVVGFVRMFIKWTNSCSIIAMFWRNGTATAGTSSSLSWFSVVTLTSSSSVSASFCSVATGEFGVLEVFLASSVLWTFIESNMELMLSTEFWLGYWWRLSIQRPSSWCMNPRPSCLFLASINKQSDKISSSPIQLCKANGFPSLC